MIKKVKKVKKVIKGLKKASKLHASQAKVLKKSLEKDVLAQLNLCVSI